MLPVWLQFSLGLVALVGGAELLVRGASGLAARARISPLVVGLTVVALGTSTPELATSLRAALDGRSDLAIGNVVGSNIMIVLLVLGTAALILPLSVQQRLVRIDAPLMVAASLAFLWFAWDGTIAASEAAVFLAALAIYLMWMARQAADENDEVRTEYDREHGAPGSRVATGLVLVVGGLGLLVLGAEWLVLSASAIALALGVSELVVGLVIVAGGTSLPELATSIVAAARGERDIAVGNIIGSNLFNILGILGVVGLVAPGGLSIAPAVLAFDLPVMVATSLVCLPILLTGFRINRSEGALLLLYYAAYAGFLLLDAQDHDALPMFSWIVAAFFLPLSALGLLLPAVWPRLRIAERIERAVTRTRPTSPPKRSLAPPGWSGAFRR